MIKIERLLEFLAEDAPFGDITTKALLKNTVVKAKIEARQDLIVAGGEEAKALFTHFGVKAVQEISDGSTAKKFEKIFSLEGTVHEILLLERTVLNLMGRMSGIATSVSFAQSKVSVINDHVKIAGTRKTAPGLREFDKKAIQLGGGEPHRMNLSDAFLIKDTHRSLVSVEEAVLLAKKYSAYHKVECEVESIADAVSAAKAGADIIMFDNMEPEVIGKAIFELEKLGLRDGILLEVSGGVTVDDFVRFAGLDIDVVSMGALTHSVRNADMSLEIIQ